MATTTTTAPATYYTVAGKVLNEEKCKHYAHFTHELNRIEFDVLYWALFFFVITMLFVASWIYEKAMKYSEDPDNDKVAVNKRLRRAMAYTAILFLIGAVAVVIEVFSLLALQFCDGEDLMSLYWSTWTMLQLGSEIAILGVVLALYHALYEIKHPKWALALGTPVLVVAGIGHVVPILAHKAAKKFHRKHKDSPLMRRLSRSVSRNTAGIESGDEAGDLANEKTNNSSGTCTADQRSRASSTVPGLMGHPNIRHSLITIEIDTGSDSEVINKWPSFIGMENGKALIQATMRHEDYDLEAQRPGN